MKGTECYFGSTNVEKNKCGKKVLSAGDYFDKGNISIHDAEIADNETSPEVVGITISEYDGEKEVEHEVFIHKKNCLQIASFLLNIHTEYANKVNELEFKSYSDEINRKIKEVEL